MWKEKFIKYLRYEKNYSSHTEISYINDLTQFERFIEKENETFIPQNIDSDLIRIWISQLMENGCTPRSVNRKLSALKTFFKYLKKQEAITHNPTDLISGPKVSRRLPSFAKDAEIREILDTTLIPTDTFLGVRDHFLIELLYLTGMRRSELIQLKDTDVDTINCTLRVTGKGNKQRLIPFSKSTLQKLKDYLQIRDAEIENKSAFLFVKENGEPLYAKLVYNIVKKHLAHLHTLSKKSPHTLRHSFATEMLNNGAEINAVKELLGHASLASTEVYTHITFEELKKTYQNAHPRAKK